MMEIAPSITTTTTASTKSPEADSDTPTRIQPAKPISFSNGVLKRHNPAHHHHSHHHNSNIPVTPIVVSYKECLKNHAASLGGHALDGCGEFMPSPTATATDPTSLKCAACGCHRNFHRRDPEDNIPAVAPTTHVIEYQPHHRHHPPPPLIGNRSPNSSSPPPISSSYYPSAPHMLLALSTGISDNPNNHHGGQIVSPGGSGPNTRKRFRTKFSQDQKDKMCQFAERVGWKMQKRDEDIVHEFCTEIGVDKGVLKVWMHNNKNTFAKRDVISGSGGAVNGIGATARIPNSTTSLDHNHLHNMNGNNNNKNTTNDEDDEDDNHPNNNNTNNGTGTGTGTGTGGSLSNIPNPNHHHHHYQVGGNHPHGITNGGSSSSS